MKVYLAGPMTGLPQFNIPAFDRIAALLREQDVEVISPAELDDPATREAALASPDGAPGSGSANGETWGDFLGRDVRLIANAGLDAVAVLPGWERSRGARLETYVANALCGLPIVTATLRLHPRVVVFDTVPPLSLYRAWTQEPTLAIPATYKDIVV